MKSNIIMAINWDTTYCMDPQFWKTILICRNMLVVTVIIMVWRERWKKLYCNLFRPYCFTLSIIDPSLGFITLNIPHDIRASINTYTKANDSLSIKNEEYSFYKNYLGGNLSLYS